MHLEIDNFNQIVDYFGQYVNENSFDFKIHLQKHVCRTIVYCFKFMTNQQKSSSRKFCFRNLAKITENPHIFAVFICQYWLMTFAVNQIGNFSSPAAWVKFMYMLGNGGGTLVGFSR